MSKDREFQNKPADNIEPESETTEAESISADELAELREKAAECDELTDKIKRVTADYINSQKRLEREMLERSDYAIEKFARELLLAADDLARAIAATREHQAIETILGGLHIVEQHLYSVLERHGITPVDAQPGHPFNPEFHEAISLEETDEHGPNRIVHEIQKGFLIHRRLLRPARVVVSTKPREEADEEDAGETE